MVYLSISGGGTNGTRLAGAASAVQDVKEISGYSGASVGSLIAALMAFGVPKDRIQDLFVKFLDGQFLQLGGPESWGRGGVLKWSAITDAVHSTLGDVELGQACKPLIVNVTNLDTQSPLYLSSISHPKVKLAEVLRASCAFMTGITPACSIPSLGTELSPDIRLFCDGGYTDNTVDAVFDRLPSPRIALRLKDDPPTRVRPGDILGIAAAVAMSSLWASSNFKSKRRDGLNILVPKVAGWEFKKTPQQVKTEFSQGYDSVLPLTSQIKNIGLT